MPQIIKINHPLKRYDKQLINIKPRMTLAEIRGMPEIIDTLRIEDDIAISVNGEIISFKEWDYRKVKEKDFILLVPWAAKGDDEKAIVNMVVMIAVMYAAPGILGTGGLGLTGITYAAAYVGVAVGTAMIISALTPRPSTPSLAFDESELSQSFGWNPATIQRQGLPKPRWYGLNKMYGNVTQAWTEITGATTNIQRLYALIDLGMGPFREVVVVASLKLNTQAAVNFDDVNFETRRGLLRQSYISYFEKTRVEFATGGLPILVKNGNHRIYETKNADYDDLGIDLAFPNGLWDGTGPSIANHTVNITIEVKKTTATSWSTLVTENITDGTTDKVIRSYTTNGIIAIDRGSKYQIRVTKNTVEKDSIQWGDDLFLDRVREVTDEPFTYPRAALVGIKALATEQLSGAIGFSCLSRGLYMIDYVDSASPIIYSTNPGLILADILTQPVYSGEHSPWHDLGLLLNFNGADTATSTIDESERGHNINFTGTAQLDTAEKKFGTASLLVDGDSDDVNIANDNNSFDICENIVDDWMIDCFVKFNDHVGSEYIACQFEDSANRWQLYNLHGTELAFILRVGGVNLITTSAAEIDDTDWHHIAVCKIGADIGLYVDGVQTGHDLMVASDAAVFDGDLFIAQLGDNSNWFKGHIDQFRIIKRNILNAAPNSTPDDTITVPTEEYTNPGNSFVVERYDGYDPSELDLAAFEELVDWCSEGELNPVNYTILDISLAVDAVITTTSKHERLVGDVVLFRGVDNHGMVELVDGTTANVIKVTDDTTFTVDLDTSGYTAFDATSWLDINSSHLDSLCGQSSVDTLTDALDGLDKWRHTVDHDHWFIIDLGETYNVLKVRGRSERLRDPIDVNIYVSNDKGAFGAAVASGINSWQDTAAWVEIDTTDKEGRYVKVEIVDTEDINRIIEFGGPTASYFTIFDVYATQSTATVEEYKPRFDFNGGFDTETTVWDAALKVCEICRCVPYFKGSKISVAIDRAGDAVFAYTSGNIIKDSFRQIFIPTTERASQIEVHYRDKEQDYQRQPFTLTNANIGNPTAKVRLDLFGITDEELAERIAENLLLKNQYIKTMARFDADIDSIASEIGDPILAPIDATKYGQTGDGRILSATNSGNAIITVPGIFIWDDPDWDGGSTAYRLMVKTADDVIETKSITGIVENSAMTETDIIVSGVFTTLPVKGDLWAAGEEEYEIKKYRVINLRQSDKQRVEVTAIEYVDAIYADD